MSFIDFLLKNWKKYEASFGETAMLQFSNNLIKVKKLVETWDKENHYSLIGFENDFLRFFEKN